MTLVFYFPANKRCGLLARLSMTLYDSEIYLSE